MKEADILSRITHVYCLQCDSLTGIEDDPPITDEGDIDRYYDAAECCDIPALEFLIVTPEPLIGSVEDDGYFVHRFKHYRYPLDDNMFELLLDD